MTLYSTGMRSFEVAKLKYKDIDSDLMQIRVEGKGRKVRYVPLSKGLFDYLTEIDLQRNSSGYVFCNEKRPFEHIPIATIAKIYKFAKSQAGIVKPGGPHQIRHSYATHSLEFGINLRELQIILGHTSLISTRMILLERTQQKYEIIKATDPTIEPRICPQCQIGTIHRTELNSQLRRRKNTS